MNHETAGMSSSPECWSENSLHRREHKPLPVEEEAQTYSWPQISEQAVFITIESEMLFAVSVGRWVVFKSWTANIEIEALGDMLELHK